MYTIYYVLILIIFVIEINASTQLSIGEKTTHYATHLDKSNISLFQYILEKILINIDECINYMEMDQHVKL